MTESLLGVDIQYEYNDLFSIGSTSNVIFFNL